MGAGMLVSVIVVIVSTIILEQSCLVGSLAQSYWFSKRVAIYLSEEL